MCTGDGPAGGARETGIARNNKIMMRGNKKNMLHVIKDEGYWQFSINPEKIDFGI